MALVILRGPAACQQLGIKRPTIYAHASKGLLTSPIKIGPSASGWPQHEIDAIAGARIAGWGNDRIRVLVRALEAHRKNLAPDVQAGPPDIAALMAEIERQEAA